MNQILEINVKATDSLVILHRRIEDFNTITFFMQHVYSPPDLGLLN